MKHLLAVLSGALLFMGCSSGGGGGAGNLAGFYGFEGENVFATAFTSSDPNSCDAYNSTKQTSGRSWSPSVLKFEGSNVSKCVADADEASGYLCTALGTVTGTTVTVNYYQFIREFVGGMDALNAGLNKEAYSQINVHLTFEVSGTELILTGMSTSRVDDPGNVNVIEMPEDQVLLTLYSMSNASVTNMFAQHATCSSSSSGGGGRICHEFGCM